MSYVNSPANISNIRGYRLLGKTRHTSHSSNKDIDISYLDYDEF